ncbi:large-conductance mechanosensitive channel protein MscL [Alkalibacterium putridalgicola]|uniref:Large-conductance mechanosensitive channel n=1 Tax=Alkalibacterium putridalgicola TaxID=426703 RepID=A0A1H7WCI1_9LACT|nr:large-conductance mechanosensitive channel protein MscL [Alkalibacterium putridalgicola]GEK89911.1 large-conductance mechanosensitive channel [Alkalibacterium putridalgicola]SEM19302.1 large conductance mechanosensitive channel [Alkalibacterium putridalgicola]
MWKEFKAFIMRGNVVELAVGIVIGASFTAIVTAFVDNIITPIIVALSGNANVGQLTFKIGEATLKYGLFLQAVIDFLIVAVVLFILIKVINQLARKEEAEPEPEVKAPTVESYLAEIRDLLAEQSDASTKESETDIR